jgi:hypothetical protein
MERLKKESACEYLKAGAERILAKKACLSKRSLSFQLGKAAERMRQAEHSLMKGDTKC